MGVTGRGSEGTSPAYWWHQGSRPALAVNTEGVIFRNRYPKCVQWPTAPTAEESHIFIGELNPEGESGALTLAGW